MDCIAYLVCTLLILFAITNVGGQTSPPCTPDVEFCATCSVPLICPYSCPRAHDNNAIHLCVTNCTSCTALCARNPCLEPGAVCNDPRFVGGDGVYFYFHGKANEDFCIVSDKMVHVNAHFIGKRPIGRPRDFTWVQKVGILYGDGGKIHTLSVGAWSNVQVWEDGVDKLEVVYDGHDVRINEGIGEKWNSPDGQVTIVRTKEVNGVVVDVNTGGEVSTMKMWANVTHIDEDENKVHKYEVVQGEDVFAHLDLKFNFEGLSSDVQGVLGQTYSPTYKRLFKADVPMPIMGGYDRFKASSLLTPDCKVTRFNPTSLILPSSSILTTTTSSDCVSTSRDGLVCRRR